ncbi:MAG: hydroxymethylbilane synthase [Gammaproteobacteria bacterium]|nr:hydroxymethylbilane synthase [Gammaproteobacteria bacterium]
MNSHPALRIATRGSRLALWQAEHVRAQLLAHDPSLRVELVIIKTLGDKILDTPLAKIGGKGLFIKELEHALIEGTADLAVHSMKDVPVEIPATLSIAAVLAREDPRDCLVAQRYHEFATLPVNARLGTSSLRRRSQLAARRGDLAFNDLRGNVTTRLAKLTNGEFDGIVLAAAGLIRLGLADQITDYFAPSELLPAVGQGIIGIECRRDDHRTVALVTALEDRDARDALEAERALNATLQGGCQVPIAGHATLHGEVLTLEGLVASIDGATIVRASRTSKRSDAAALGTAVGQALLAAGADRILAELATLG